MVSSSSFAQVLLAAAVGVLPAAGCTKNPGKTHPKNAAMNQFPDIPGDIKKQLAFTCAYEKDRIPPRDPEADQLYKHARWLIKANTLRQVPEAHPPIERLLRIATAHGHDRANVVLRQMMDKGQAQSDDPVNETIDMVQDLIKRGIPAGYYGMARYLENGYGVEQDQELALKYFRKAADLGNPEGQYFVGDLLNDFSKHGREIASIGLAMQRCAAEQGHAEAALDVGVDVRQKGLFPEAMKYFQLGAMAGSYQAANRLSEGFGESQGDPIYDLGQSIDPRRQERYKKISDFLFDYSYLNPQVPELDSIVPLPPAKLPPWDGKFKWLEAHEANVPPPLPTEERIAEMAKAKGLDPKTGRRVESRK